MDIKEKMKLCFNQELMENKVLTENEKKVLASLMYSYQICKEAKDNIIIRAMPTLREDIKINTNAMYDAIRNLESLYHMIERTAGEYRVNGKSSKASMFKLNFDAIFNPPKERMRFDFSKKAKSSETSINTADIDTDIVTDKEIVTDIDIDTIIDKNIEKDSDIETNKKFDIDCNIEIEQDNDVVFENEISNTNILYNNSSFEGKEELLSMYKLNELIKGFSKVKDADSLIKHFQEVVECLGRQPKETQEKYSGRLGSAIEKCCNEVGIDSNILYDYC